MPGTVVVACKHPPGMVLWLEDKIEVTYDVLGGGKKTVEEYRRRPGSKVVYINGPAVPFGKAPKQPIEGGYALTFNVDADFFNEWIKQKKDAEYVVNRIIFAFAKEGDTVGEARKMETIRTGLEPIDPNAPPGEFGRRRITGEGAAFSPIAPATGG